MISWGEKTDMINIVMSNITLVYDITYVKINKNIGSFAWCWQPLILHLDLEITTDSSPQANQVSSGWQDADTVCKCLIWIKMLKVKIQEIQFFLGNGKHPDKPTNLHPLQPRGQGEIGLWNIISMLDESLWWMWTPHWSIHRSDRIDSDQRKEL